MKGTIEINGNIYREYINGNTGEAFLCRGSEIIAETQTHHGMNEVWEHNGNYADDVKAWANSYCIKRIILTNGRR